MGESPHKGTAAEVPGDRSAPSRLGVVIPTLDRRDQVVALVQRLAREHDVAEIIVVDDGSSDASAHALADMSATELRLQIVKGPGEGAAAARLAGAERATSDVVLFLDDDVMPEPGLPTGHLRHHGDGKPLVVVGYMPTRRPTGRTAIDFATHFYAQEYERRCDVFDADPSSILRNLWLGNVSISREAFLDATRRWPEPLPDARHEDQLLGLRLRELGVDAIFDRSLLATHEHARTLAQFRRGCRGEGVGRALLETRFAHALDAVGVEQFGRGLPLPLRTVVTLTRQPLPYRTTSSALAAVVTVTGAAKLYRPQAAAARLLRRVEQQQGYLQCSASSRRPAV